MTAPACGFLSLVELLEAKYARKIELQAEIARIDQELTQALQLLQEQPRLATPTIAAVPSPPAAAPPLIERPLEDRFCIRCSTTFSAPQGSHKKLCVACLQAGYERSAERARTGRTNRGVRTDSVARAVDQRLESYGV